MANKTKSRRSTAAEPVKRSENSEMRKLRNRISQKAFRARKAMRLKELEERLHDGISSDAEWKIYLQDQNAALREQLLECHKKFVSLQVSMKALVDASALALGIESLHDVKEIESTSGRLIPQRQCLVDEQDEDSPNATTTSGPKKRTSDITSLDLSNPTSNGNNGSVNHIQYRADDHDDQVPGDAAKDTSDGGWADFTERSENQPAPILNLNYFSPLGCTKQFEIDGQNHLSAKDRFCPEPLSMNLVVSEDLGPLNFSPLDSTEQFENGGQNHLSAKDRFCPEPLSMNLVMSEDLGPLRYRNILETLPPRACQSSKFKKTNSLFSDHIDALEHCVGWSCSRWSTSPIPDDRISRSIQSILLTFVSLSWQSMTAWHTHTRAHVPLVELMAWRIWRTPDRYVKIVPPYQPTKLQMSVSYPSIIDWIPWPQLRDKLIIHHAANPCLDSIICDIGDSYVVCADLSLIIKCPQPVLGYVGVWDLVRAIAPEASGSPESSPSKSNAQLQAAEHQPFPPFPAPCRVQTDHTNTAVFENLALPAKDVKSLFSSRELAAQAFRVLELDKGAFNFRLDPAFFGRHPELYDSSADLLAQGVALRPNDRISISAPRELDVSIVGQYQEMSRYLVDSALESRHVV